MSEAFDATLKRVDLKKYVDELEAEMSKVAKGPAPSKAAEEMEAAKRRIEEILRRQAVTLAAETGVRGNFMFVFMLMSSILTTAWTSFAIKRGIIDMGRPFEERLKLEELLGSLGLVLSDVVSRSSEYADMYKK